MKEKREMNERCRKDSDYGTVTHQVPPYRSFKVAKYCANQLQTLISF